MQKALRKKRTQKAKRLCGFKIRTGALSLFRCFCQHLLHIRFGEIPQRQDEFGQYLLRQVGQHRALVGLCILGGQHMGQSLAVHLNPRIVAGGDERTVQLGSLVCQQAQQLGGYEHDRSMSGINGGHMLTTGFARAAVLAHADEVIDAVKRGQIRRILLVGGCDGAHPGRNYYTELVKKAPMDTLILTLACGKFRFNDLDLGEVGGLPRILDMGQCNDAYSAVQVALALADAFGCGVNDLPLTLVLSWYEQKAVCILLTLLSLGIKNMYLGPTMPAFLSESVVKILVETYGLQPITAPEQDLDAILGR